METLGELQRFVHGGIVIGVTAVVMVIVQLLKQDKTLQGVATVRVVIGLSLAISMISCLLLMPDKPLAETLFTGFLTGVFSAASAVGLKTFYSAAAKKEV